MHNDDHIQNSLSLKGRKGNEIREGFTEASNLSIIFYFSIKSLKWKENNGGIFLSGNRLLRGILSMWLKNNPNLICIYLHIAFSFQLLQQKPKSF